MFFRSWAAMLAVIGSLTAISLTACGGSTAEESSAPGAVAAAALAGEIPEASYASAAEAALAFIDTLSIEQRERVIYELDVPVRANWSNLPASMVNFERNGVRIGDLDTQQRRAMHDFLATALSPAGFATVLGIAGADGEAGSSLLDRMNFLSWSEADFWLAFFGEPAETAPWGWQFGGHHLAVNVTFAGGSSYMSPTFLGIEPASYSNSGATIEPLSPHTGAGLALVRSLSVELREAATVAERPGETYTGAGKDGVIPKTEGSRVADWPPERQAKLLELVSLWPGLLPEPDAKARLAEIEADLNDLYFAWHGPTDGAGAIYYRIQGPSLIIEFSTQGDLDPQGGHYHSVYRDPTNEYGRRVVASGF